MALQRIPAEILLEITSHLLVWGKMRFRATCKRYRKAIKYSNADKIVIRATRVELRYLAKFRSYNDHVKIDEELVYLLGQYRTQKGRDNSSEEAVRQAVQEARTTERLMVGLGKHMYCMAESFRPDLNVDVTAEDIHFGANISYLARDNVDRDFRKKRLPQNLNEYDDDWDMDNLIVMILLRGEATDMTVFMNDIYEHYMKIFQDVGGGLSRPERVLKHFEKISDPEHLEIINIRKELQTARDMIRTEKLALTTPKEQKSFNDDSRMADLLAPLLHKDRAEMGKVLQLARARITFDLAVREKKLFVLRKIVEWTGNSTWIKNAIDRIVPTVVDENHQEVLAILVQHPQFSSELLERALFESVRSAVDQNLNREQEGGLISILLGHRSAVRPGIDKAFDYAKENNYTLVLEMFYESGRIKKGDQ